MANTFLAPNRIDLEIEGVLDALASGAGPHGSEREHVDV
jgi:hypothetical protein